MIIHISTQTVLKEGLSMTEAYLLLALSLKKTKLDDEYSRLLEQELIEEDLTGNVIVTRKGLLKLSDAVSSDDISSNQSLSEINKEKKEREERKKREEELAQHLIELFPKGKKDGTATPWRGSSKEIADRLEKFYRYYQKPFTDEFCEDIYLATQKYVNSFNGDYRFMRVLKYFILKSIPEGDLGISQVSDLAALLENPEDEITNTDWTATMV